MDQIKIIDNKILSDNWYTLSQVAFEYQNKQGKVETLKREIYHSANGITILLYNKEKRSVILTKQFRLATYMNANSNGMLIETCAGLLEDEDPEAGIRRETEEETGYKVKKVDKVLEAYMAPGSATEKLHFYIAEYDESMKVREGGGLAEEQEEIEVLELPFDQAINMIFTGKIQDAKTILLLFYMKSNQLIS